MIAVRLSLAPVAISAPSVTLFRPSGYLTAEIAFRACTASAGGASLFFLFRRHNRLRRWRWAIGHRLLNDVDREAGQSLIELLQHCIGHVKVRAEHHQL